MLIRLLLLPVLFLLYFASCKKETVITYDFSKYTATDISGNVIGEPDPTDWTNDELWTAYEYSLMRFRDTLSVTDSVGGYIQIGPLISNPNTGLFLIGTDTEKQCKMKVVCVNTNMQVLYFNTIKFTGGPNLTFFDVRGISAFRPNHNYRMYYAFFTAKDSVYYKGHGDFRMASE